MVDRDRRTAFTLTDEEFYTIGYRICRFSLEEHMLAILREDCTSSVIAYVRQPYEIDIAITYHRAGMAPTHIKQVLNQYREAA